MATHSRWSRPWPAATWTRESVWTSWSPSSTSRCSAKYRKLLGYRRGRHQHPALSGPGQHVESRQPAQGAERLDKLEDVMNEIPVVRKAMGYPPLVTPDQPDRRDAGDAQRPVGASAGRSSPRRSQYFPSTWTALAPPGPRGPKLAIGRGAHHPPARRKFPRDGGGSAGRRGAVAPAGGRFLT